MMARPITSCIFCGAANVTKEHVFSRWTHQYLGPREKGKALSLQGIRNFNRKETREAKLPGQLRDWQVKAVCGGDTTTCNNGWMRSLEERARPLLEQLITGVPKKPDQDGKFQLSAKEQELIAAWAALKAIVGQYGEGDWPTTHHTQRKRLRAREIPPENGWGIWIGHFERKAWRPGWVSTAISILPEKSKRFHAKKPYFNSHSTTQVIGNLFIQVIHTPMPGFIERWRFPLPHKGTLIRIWPPANYSVRWPLGSLDDTDADAIASAFFKWMDAIASRAAPNEWPDDDSWHPPSFRRSKI